MIEIQVDARKALGQIHDDGVNQIPFALANAVNSTALDVQRAARNRARSVFTIRRPEWVDRSMKIKQFATKRNPTAIVGIHPPGATGAQRVDILGKFETDTQKLPRGRSIAIPVSSRIKRGNSGIISSRDRPKAYNFRQVGKKIIGDRGTFIIRKADGSGMIFQRVKGPKAPKGMKRSSSIFALYILARRARIVPDLKFIPTAQNVVDTRFNAHMVREFDKAVAGSKWKVSAPERMFTTAMSGTMRVNLPRISSRSLGLNQIVIP